MQIKVFKAGTMKEAMAAMKAELGPNAIILHSKKYKESGLWGLRSREIVEITAAVEESTMATKQPKTAPPPRYKPSTAAANPVAKNPEPPLKNVFPENSPVEIESQSDAEILNSQEDSLKKIPAPIEQPAPHVEEKPAPKPSENLRTTNEAPLAELTPAQIAQVQAMMLAQLNQNQPPVEEKSAPPVEPPPKSEAVTESPEQSKIRRLEDEIAQMKALLAEVLGKENQKSGISLQEALRLQEIDESIVAEMSVGTGDILVDSQSSAAKWMFTAYLNGHLKFSDGIKLNPHGVKIIALLGTTGVGKTTTLAKIAAKFVLEQGISAAMITADTYRISAVDQLRTYSDILGLPLEVVYSPQELTAAIERHQNKDLILIDTAGRSQHNDFQMQELADFLNANPQIEKHLVLSSTTKLTDAREIIKRFAAVKPEKIIVTKIDETGGLGMVVNLLRDEKLALSYVTTGQSVPDDIEIASAEVLTNIFLKKASEYIA